MGAIDPLVHVLRKTTEPGVQRNLAIVCARLCQAGAFLLFVFIKHIVSFLCLLFGTHQLKV